MSRGLPEPGRRGETMHADARDPHRAKDGRRARLRHIAAVVAVIAAGGFAVRAHAVSEVGEAQAPPVAPRPVAVFAATSLAASFQTLVSAFQAAHPDTSVLLNLAGSSNLVQQILEGAPADVFASADEANMQKLVERGVVVGVPQLFARNTLQIVVTAGNPKRIATLADLAKPGLTLALCGPTVPCGRYAADAFRKAGLTVPAASQEMDVKAVLSKVALGEADAGIVYATDVRAAGRTVEGIDIPEPVNVIARYPLAVLQTAADRRTADAFVAFVLSPAGQQVLGAAGFRPR